MNVSDRYLERALNELDALRAENEVLKQKLSKVALKNLVLRYKER